MTKGHKRKFVDYFQDAQQSNNPQDYEGVGQLLAELKKPPSRESPLQARSNIRMTPSDEPCQANDPWQSASCEWQIAGRKNQRKPKRERTPDVKDRIRYPELACHGKVTSPIRIADLQALTLYTLADGIAPSWVAFKHARHIQKVVVLMVPGLELGIFNGTISLEGESGLSPNPERCPDGQERSFPGILQPDDNGFRGWNNGATANGLRPGNPTSITADSLARALQPLAGIFDDIWSVKAPGDSRYAKLHSPIRAMLISPLPQSKENKAIRGPKPPAEERDWQPQQTSITEFIHTKDELRDAEYPLHPAIFQGDSVEAVLEQERRDKTGQNAEGGWVNTSVSSAPDSILPSTPIQKGSITAGRTVYAVDCEMVLTSDDKYSLARISVVDWSGMTVLDELVKPSLPIKNYFTQFSGMTAGVLDSVQTTLSEVQSKLLDLFTPQSILLGHSLESDLAAMKLTHPFIIDTSLIYPHPRGPPLRSSLKFLAQKYLRRSIQQQDLKGHNSVEDALAVLDLVKLKCEKGPKWGTWEAGGEPIFRRLARNKKKDVGGKERGITSAMVDYGTPELGYGKEATVPIGCGSDVEVVEAVVRAVNGDADGKVVPGGGVDFTWARLREVERLRGWCNDDREHANVDVSDEVQGGHLSVPGFVKNEEQDAPESSCKQAHQIAAKTDNARMTPEAKLNTPPYTSPNLNSTIASTISHIRNIYDSLPSCTLFIIYTGMGDPREVSRLQKMQHQFRKEFKVKRWDDLSVKWTDKEEQALRMAVERAREGLGFMCIK